MTLGGCPEIRDETFWGFLSQMNNTAGESLLRGVHSNKEICVREITCFCSEPIDTRCWLLSPTSPWRLSQCLLRVWCFLSAIVCCWCTIVSLCNQDSIALSLSLLLLGFNTFHRAQLALGSVFTTSPVWVWGKWVRQHSKNETNKGPVSRYQSWQIRFWFTTQDLSCLSWLLT